MSFVLLMGAVLMLLWTVLIGALVTARREQREWNAIMHTQISYFRWVGEHVWLLVGMALPLTLEYLVLSWLTLR